MKLIFIVNEGEEMRVIAQATDPKEFDGIQVGENKMAKRIPVKERNYCGIVFLLGGLSFAWAASAEDAAIDAARATKRDWGRMFKLSENLKVNIYDMHEHEGWVYTDEGVLDADTRVRIPLLGVFDVELKKFTVVDRRIK
jgi:hypothetical protein